jgi:hypothetical protein
MAPGATVSGPTGLEVGADPFQEADLGEVAEQQDRGGVLVPAQLGFRDRSPADAATLVQPELGSAAVPNETRNLVDLEQAVAVGAAGLPGLVGAVLGTGERAGVEARGRGRCAAATTARAASTATRAASATHAPHPSGTSSCAAAPSCPPC